MLVCNQLHDIAIQLLSITFYHPVIVCLSDVTLSILTLLTPEIRRISTRSTHENDSTDWGGSHFIIVLLMIRRNGR